MSDQTEFFFDPSCDVCHQSRQTLDAQRIAYHAIDVSAEPHRRPAKAKCLPALTVGGRLYARGRFVPVLLKRLLDAGVLRQVSSDETPFDPQVMAR